MDAAYRNMTPEEKLLNIIESPGGGDTPGPGKGAKKFKFPSLGGGHKKITIRETNKLLLWISVVLTVVVVLFFIKEKHQVNSKFQQFKDNVMKEEPAALFAKKDMPTISQFVSDTEKNNPFQILPVADQPVRGTTQKPGLDLQLVGILWGDQPQAVLEDTVSKRNYMVYEGDSVNEFKVKEITPNSVRLVSDEGKEIQLR